MFQLVCQIASISCMIALMVLIVLSSRKHRIEKDGLEDSLRSTNRENESLEHLNQFLKRENESLEHLNQFLKRENEKLNQKINGGRYPDKSCVGCKHLIIRTVPSPLGPCVPGETVYICLKNVRCNEYEE